MFIEDYRRANGLELDDFARRVNLVGKHMQPPLEGTVSDTLIHILERSKVPRTHPRIADAIATVCGATAEQRDSIVAEHHRGTWTPVRMSDVCGRKVTQGPKPWDERPVVMIDKNGHVLKTYKNITNAAVGAEISTKGIASRCKRMIKGEFDRLDYTYRYANEWSRMSMEEKLRDLGHKINE